MIVAIQPDLGPVHSPERDRSSPRWAELLESAGHDVRVVDVYRADILDQLRGCDGFMWRHGHTRGMWHIARRLLPIIERELGLVIYPDQNTCWHYDDKIAQAHLFKAAGIPAPKTWVWFDEAAALEWAASAAFPVVLKLWSGAQASNVRLVHSADEAVSWVRRLFSSGVHSLADSDINPLPWKRRLKEAARVTVTGRASPPPRHRWDLHKNYILFQEFLPDNEYDTRITVIGHRAFGIRRYNRPDDFRASGSGLFEHDPALIDPDAVRFGFEVAERLGTQSLALDILRKDGRWVVAEISYTYASWAVHDCPGHWEFCETATGDELEWHPGRMWPEEAQIADFLERLEQRQVRRKHAVLANDGVPDVPAARLRGDATGPARG